MSGALMMVLMELAGEVPHRRKGPLPMPRIVASSLRDALAYYRPIRNWVLAHPVLTLAVAICVVALFFWLARAGLGFWNNHVVARLTGSYFSAANFRIPTLQFDLLEQIARRPAGQLFVGMRRVKTFFGWRWKPTYLSQKQKSMHRHVMGKTGSGKTLGVLWPAVLQDALDGKGAIVMDAKGSDENIRMMKSIAALTRRENQLRVFSLPAWNRPTLFSHTYNLVWVRPRTKKDTGGDPGAVAERVFSILTLGDNAYYNTQAEVLFVNLFRLLHGIVDSEGTGVPFNVKDLSACLKGIGVSGSWASALHHCLQASSNREAAREIQSQLVRLGRDAAKCFSGLVAALDKFLSPLVNAYAPDIILEEALEQNLLLYIQLPANLFKLQAPAVGKAMLMDLQQEGSLRQVDRDRNQRPFSVTLDEFYNFADLSIVDSLNKLRDANLEFTLAHQSLADLELVSKEFATVVWDNTRTKDVLNQDNPELCEKISRGIGTHQVRQKTVRIEQGALFTSRITGDASSKLVEEYRLHPNAIKNLARCGQGYLLNDEGMRAVCYGLLPNIPADFELKRREQENAPGLNLYKMIPD